MIGTKGRLSHYNLYVCVCESLAAQGLFVAARGIFSCGVWDLVPWSGIHPWLPALGAQNLSH